MNYLSNLRKADINISTSGDNTIIVAPTTTGNYLALDFVSFIPTTAVTVQFKDGTVSETPTNYGGPMPLDAKQALTWENAIHNEHGIITLSPNKSFVLNLDGNVQVGGIVRYREIGN